MIKIKKYCCILFINLFLDEDCFWGNGETYRGIQDISANGTKCLKWAHQFQVKLSNHPELAGHSYCRNPDGLEAEPFCYIEQTVKEVCNVSKCGKPYFLIISFK